MRQTSRLPPVGCAELAVFGLFGCLIAVGLVTNGRGLVDVVAAVGFGAVVLLAAWGWQWTCRRAASRPPPGIKQRVWDLLAALALLAGLGACACPCWWYGGDRDGGRHRAPPPAADPVEPAEPQDQDDQPQQPRPPRPAGGDERRAGGSSRDSVVSLRARRRPPAAPTGPPREQTRPGPYATSLYRMPGWGPPRRAHLAPRS